MKLRTRITLIAALVILFAAAVSDSIIWGICRRTLMREAEQTVYAKMLSLQTDYLDFNAQSHGILSDAEQRFFFKQRGDDYVICLDGAAEIFNQTILTPSDLRGMETTEYANSFSVSHGFLQSSGHRLLIAKGESAGLTLYAVHDLADVTRRLRLLALGMLGVLLCVCIPAVIVLYLLLHRTMKPLGSLSDSAKQIAAGAYEERAAVSGNDEIGLLAQDFNLMADAVQEKINALAESEQRKTMFMADFSHELKTPLTAISGYAQTLRTVKLSEEDKAEALGYIYSESKRLDRLAKKMMRLMQLDRTESLQMLPVDNRELLDAVLATCQPAARAKDITLQIEKCSGIVRGDFDLLHDALCNLTDNAVKASKQGKTVRLSAELDNLTVTDEGCGIPPEEIKNLTEPFYMVDKSRSRQSGGAGLGLSLVKQIVQLHGANLEIESTLGKGTQIHLRFSE
ncbi:MAG: HAMP domain-containing histidine kinase [Oscillospiraceae bacterium]|nr:HAMP domain-containing histidine kinase [Oscillospiraceae bacterium]